MLFKSRETDLVPWCWAATSGILQHGYGFCSSRSQRRDVLLAISSAEASGTTNHRWFRRLVNLHIYWGIGEYDEENTHLLGSMMRKIQTDQFVWSCCYPGLGQGLLGRIRQCFASTFAWEGTGRGSYVCEGFLGHLSHSWRRCNVWLWMTSLGLSIDGVPRIILLGIGEGVHHFLDT